MTDATTDTDAQEAAYAAAREALTDDKISAAIWMTIAMKAFDRVSIMSKHPVRAD